jgi:hypothetical protein
LPVVRTILQARRQVVATLLQIQGSIRGKLAVTMRRMWVSGEQFETGVEKPKLAAV